MRIRSRGLNAALALVLVTAATAGAYVLDEDGHGHPLYWNDMPVEYLLVTNNIPAGADGEAAVHQAFEAWNAASSNVHYEFGGYVAAGVQQYDGKNIVYWLYGDWPYDPTLAALTFRYYDTSDGHLLDADTVFNGERFTWTVGGSGYDIQNSATHEAGHFGGLGHSLDPEATMYAKTQAGEIKKRTLETDDVDGIEALYGGTRVAAATQRVVAPVSGASLSGVSGGGGGCSLDRSGRSATFSDVLWPSALIAILACRRARPTAALRRH